MGVACQWDAHCHQPVADPFWNGFKLGDEICVDGEANTGLPGFISCLATPEESVAPTSARFPVAVRRVSLSGAMSALYVEG